jgi:hypothetical protein
MSSQPICRHCGVIIAEDPPGWWAHVVGPGSRLRRCDPANSGQPYGREAAPSGEQR